MAGELRKAKRARTCASPDCHNLFAVISRRIYCTDECGYDTFKKRQARRNFRIISCQHPLCANLFRPRTAQRYCAVECRRDDRRCSKCGIRLPDDQNGSKNATCRTCDRVSKYGITSIEYHRMLKQQDYGCRICGKEHEDAVRTGMDGPLVVDHCHDTDRVRGLLCAKCNMAIGLLGDDAETAISAAVYLVEHKPLPSLPAYAGSGRLSP